MLWREKLVARDPTVGFAPDQLDHPIAEHAKPDRDRMAGLGFERGAFHLKMLSSVREAGGGPQTAKNVNGFFKRRHLFSGRALGQAKGAEGRLVHRRPAAQREHEPTIRE